MPREFVVDDKGRVLVLPTEAEAMADGYRNGLKWNEDWKPGGPYYYTARDWEHPLWKVYCEATKQNHAAWLRGWEEARG